MIGGSMLLGAVFVQAAPSFTLDTYPRIDGSLACVPLGVALTEKLTGCSEMEAEEVMSYITNTNPCYLQLANGDTDFILAYEPSEETKEQLKGYEPQNMVPIGQDALVFLVNENNPVESLSQQQIIDIFAGRITNWKEVGGNDQEIKAFQRPENSGSQTLMRKLLVGDLDMVEEHVAKISTMEGMLDSIMEYNNEANAIGYSVYYYAEEMMHKEGIRLLQVDGVAPSEESIYDGSYTLVNPFYCSTNSLSSDGAKEIQNWLTTEEGQDFIAECGYVRINQEAADAVEADAIAEEIDAQDLAQEIADNFEADDMDDFADPEESEEEGDIFYYSGTLVGDNTWYDLQDAITSVTIENSMLNIEGGVRITKAKGFSNKMGARVFTQDGGYHFIVNPSTVYMSYGGDDDHQITQEEFLQIAQSYNGLGLSLTIQDGVVKEAAVVS